MTLPVTLSRAWHFAVLAAVVTGLTVTPAAATQDQPVLAGQTNTATEITVLNNTFSGVTCTAFSSNYGLETCGNEGLISLGAQVGVEARAASGTGWGVLARGATGVEGDSAQSGGTGVLGTSQFAAGIGVEGAQTGTGSGVYGLATANGVGVFGDTTNGTGVIARSTNGNALDVRGKAVFSRSGQVTLAAGTATKKITLAGVTNASMILATAQQDGTVYVRSAVPASGSFTIHLTGKAPASGLKVAYFVLN
jgi:hypothetical protein